MLIFAITELLFYNGFIRTIKKQDIRLFIRRKYYAEKSFSNN